MRRINCESYCNSSPVILAIQGFAQILPPFQNPQCEHWADSVLQTLSPDERIGQLFMVAAYSDTSSKHKDDKEKLAKLINEQKIGGLIFFKGTPVHKLNFVIIINLFPSSNAYWYGCRMGTCHAAGQCSPFPFSNDIGCDE